MVKNIYIFTPDLLNIFFLFQNTNIQSSTLPNDEEEGIVFQHLDVHDPNSPYGLIQDILTPSQSNAGINKKKIPDLNSNDLGGLQSNEVWLSEGNLLILKGISSIHNKYITKKY